METRNPAPSTFKPPHRHLPHLLPGLLQVTPQPSSHAPHSVPSPTAVRCAVTSVTCVWVGPLALLIPCGYSSDLLAWRPRPFLVRLVAASPFHRSLTPPPTLHWVSWHHLPSCVLLGTLVYTSGCAWNAFPSFPLCPPDTCSSLETQLRVSLLQEMAPGPGCLVLPCQT